MTKSTPNDDRRRDVALFRLAVLGDLVHQQLRRGELRAALEAKAQIEWSVPHRRDTKIAAKTIESWLTRYRRGGFDSLFPRLRSDRMRSRAIPAELANLIVELKRERPGRSAAQIVTTLVDLRHMQRSDFSVSSVQRLLAREGLSGPQMELEVPARHRFTAAATNELWQVDAVHGPKLFDPNAGRPTTVKIFGLIDDRSRLVAGLRGSFHERQQDFLLVLHEAIRRRGVPRTLLLDNHGSFTGADVKVVCAQLGIRLVHARPYDGASKGKIERFWRTLRSHVLDELDLEAVQTLDDLNLRVMNWVDGRYNLQPHGGLEGRTPLSVFEEGAADVRFVSDLDELAKHFVVRVERSVRNDATCTLEGRTFEVPQHLRRTKVTLCYAVLRPDSVWIVDGGTIVSELGATRPPAARPSETT
ncbi:MAG: DDE-type integrase/transposase/recombinase [Planctomycetota bacterium]